jgi:DNA-nicking Smr family endonuclease
MLVHVCKASYGEYFLSQKTMKDYITGVKLNTTRHSIIKPSKTKPVPIRSVSFLSKAEVRQARDGNLLSINRKSQRKFVPEKVIDLHGLSQNEAFSALLSFFVQCQAEGTRRALVITGGNSMKESILRDSFPKWVHNLFGNYVAACSQSNRRHGGQGAFYLQLKKSDTKP